MMRKNVGWIVTIAVLSVALGVTGALAFMRHGSPGVSIAAATVAPTSDEDAPVVLPASDEVVQVVTTGFGGSSSVAVDDYPAALKNAPKDSFYDQWGFSNRNCTSFVAWRLASRDGYTITISGDAKAWLGKGHDIGVNEDTTPTPGSVAWRATSDPNDRGHVAWVDAVVGDQVEIEDYNHHNDGNYDHRLEPISDFQKYIHFKDLPTPTPAPSVAPTLTVGVAGGSSTEQGGNQSATNLQGGKAGAGNDLQPAGGASQSGPVGTSLQGGGTTSGQGGGDSSTTVTPTQQPAPPPPPAPLPPAAPPAPSTHTETPGSTAHVWSNYANAGGTEGRQLTKAVSVQVTCAIEGFAVQDGNRWWYALADQPGYYVSADAFYNNGATSGSLKGTPWVDPAVPHC